MQFCQPLFYSVNTESFVYDFSLVMAQPTTQWDCREQVSKTEKQRVASVKVMLSVKL